MSGGVDRVPERLRVVAPEPGRHEVGKRGTVIDSSLAPPRVKVRKHRRARELPAAVARRAARTAKEAALAEERDARQAKAAKVAEVAARLAEPDGSAS